MKWENGEKDREGEEKNEGREAQFHSRVCPRDYFLREERGRCQHSQLRELLIAIYRDSHHGYCESIVSIVQVL